MIILETDRLILRHFIADDLDALYALYRDPEIRRYFPDGTRSYEETREEMEWYFNGHPSYPQYGLWAAVLKETGQLVGRCGLLPWHIDGQDEVEIAYLIDKARWNQGLATEAAAGIRDHAFTGLGLSRLVCLIDKDNVPSIRVAMKTGMVFEKSGEDEFGPFQLYAITKT